MLKTFVVSVHGTSGQGVEAAVNVIAKAAVITGLHSQTIFFPSMERRGAHVFGLVKMDRNPILSKQIEESDISLIFESELEKKAIMKEGSTVILNTTLKLDTKSFKKHRIKAFSVDATGLSATMTSKKTIPNLAMLGAFAKVYGKLSLKSLKTASESFAKDTSVMDEGFKTVKMVK